MRDIFKLMILVICLQTLSSCSVIFHNRRQAYREIDMLKHSSVVVKLKSADTRIKYFIETGQKDEAIKLQDKLYLENREIVAAVKAGFDFCDFYFLESSMAKTLKQENFDQLQITDKDDKIVEDVSFLKDDYYVMTFDGIYETEYIKVDENGRRHSVGGNGRKPGMALLDRDFIQLKKPFPYKVYTRQKLFQDLETVGKLVEFYNNSLHSFYNNNYGKVQKYKDRK